MKKDPYHRVAKLYDKLFQQMNTSLIAIGVKMFPPVEGMSVLDIGCGTGTLLGNYQKAGCRIFGIDLSPAMIKIAREKLSGDAELSIRDANSTQFQTDSFDLVTAMFVLHEMSPATRKAVMDEICRILKRTGRILLIDYHTGPLKPLKGWFKRVIITIVEFCAGQEHYRNYRNFMAKNGIPSLVSGHEMVIEQQKIVGGGNFGLFLLKRR